MRIKIDTNGKSLKDADVRALYILLYALDTSTPRMKIANLRYIADRFGYDIVKKTKQK
jgi:hypothetical protein